MSQNPYEAPQSTPVAVGVRSGDRADLLAVAKAQKGVLVCILAQIVLVIARLAATAGVEAGPANGASIAFELLLIIITLAVGITSTVFVFLLAIKVYPTGTGVLMGILTLVPCIGLIVLLIINAKATTVLKENGIKVGLLGANLAEVRAAVSQ